MEYNLLFINAIILIRLFLPLTILRWPLVGILLCLVFDGVDQTLLQNYSTADLGRYQYFDKALDIYYLSIAVMYSARSWKNEFASKVAQVLFVMRLVGFFAFETTQIRAILFLLPNVFEYFFIYYEAYGLKWNKDKMSKRHVLTAVAAIWIFIKLPQEYIIHIAQIDTTDWIKEHILGQAVQK